MKKKFSINSTKFLLVGNPNTGKTTLFNSLTKSNEHVGNWHGVTVSEKEKDFIIEDTRNTLVDLPGLYSLTPLSYEEEVGADYIMNNLSSPVINICDINNLKKNLFLTLQVAEINKNIILFINTFKNKNKIKKQIINTEKNLNKLGIKYFIGDANNKKDVLLFKNLLLNIFISKKLKNNLLNFNYLNNNNINLIKSIIVENCYKNNLDPNYMVTRLLENDKKAEEKLNLNAQKKEYLNKIIKKNNFIELNKKRFNFINNLFEKNEEKIIYGKSILDKIFLNKFFALPIFFGILFLIFYLTFFSVGASLSNLLREFIQNVIGGKFISWLQSVCDIIWIIDLFETGIIGGVGTLLAFLPQVILLFFFLSLIEDSGYLARIAFLFEDIFAKVGLSGKSVYTLLMSFGCGTTATLTARNMEDKNAKIKTALLTPYMSCSAKLPIYAVIGGAFFGANNVFIIFALYILGIIIALLLSLILEQKFLKSKEQSFILEFPAYRIPSFIRVIKILWENLKLFLIRIGTLIFTLNIIIWILQSFSFSLKFVQTNPNEVSILQGIGSVLAPIFSPIGFGNWGAVSALIAGLAAKEIIVSSIAMINGIDVMGDNMKNQTMRSIIDPAAAICFSPAGALSFMLFCLLYSPCLPTISVFKKEIGKKWTFFAILIQFLLAYTVCLILYNIYILVEIWEGLKILICFFTIFIIIISILSLINRIKNKKFCNYNCNKCGKCKK